MKVIDLLNRIANGEEVPKKIKYDEHIWLFKEDVREYLEEYDLYKLDNFEFGELNDEVEIIEEQKEEAKTTTRESIEALGYACGEIQKCFINGWEKSLKNKSLNEEDKKIEELENKIDTTFENYNYSERMRLTEMVNKINEIIDYLKEK